ncbi:MAG TPA: MBL fold metallo-hydrolase [Xanthobacteraceae bacterium]|jgi:metallo-beta-lactamase class B|nr:MBL fold metallo-hydrolase [Xanthobacteraceae bacterium]
MDFHRQRVGRLLFCLAAQLIATTLPPASATAQAPKPEELSESYRGSQRNNVAYQKVAPFKVFDNLYYVGPGFVSTWILKTRDGAILIDTAQEPYVDHVVDSIKKAGVTPADIKYILLTHSHLDHFGGAARIAELTGARVGALEEDWRLIEAAGNRPGRDNAPPPGVPRRDMVLKEGDTLTLVGETLKFYRHPGHTPGSLSAEFNVYDNGVAHKAFLFGGPGPRDGVAGGEQFLSSVNRVAELPGVEVHVMVHSWLASYPYPNGGIFERAIKLQSRKPGEPHPFVDTASWRQWMNTMREGAVKNLDDERRKAAAR